MKQTHLLSSMQLFLYWSSYSCYILHCAHSFAIPPAQQNQLGLLILIQQQQQQQQQPRLSKAPVRYDFTDLRAQLHHRQKRKTHTSIMMSSTSSTDTTETTKSILTTLPQYLEAKGVDEELCNVICATATACIRISQELQRLPITNYIQDNEIGNKNGNTSSDDKQINIQGEVQKEMDIVANDIFIDKVKDTVVVMTSEEEEHIIKGEMWDSFYSSDDNGINDTIVGSNIGYEIAFDPLDGSSNLDVNIPTG